MAVTTITMALGIETVRFRESKAQIFGLGLGSMYIKEEAGL